MEARGVVVGGGVVGGAGGVWDLSSGLLGSFFSTNNQINPFIHKNTIRI